MNNSIMTYIYWKWYPTLAILWLCGIVIPNTNHPRYGRLKWTTMHRMWNHQAPRWIKTSPSSFGRVTGSPLTRLHLHPCISPFCCSLHEISATLHGNVHSFSSCSSQNVQLAQRGRRWHGPSVIQYGQNGHTRHDQKHCLQSTSPPATPQGPNWPKSHPRAANRCVWKGRIDHQIIACS